MTLPTVTATGQLGAEPELRFTASGTAVANFTLACNDNRKNPTTGQWEQAGTTWLRCTAWPPLAEAVADQLAKGDTVTITGRWRQRGYDRDGQQRTAEEIHLDSLSRPIRPNRPENGTIGGTNTRSGTNEAWGTTNGPQAGAQRFADTPPF
ncbi:single-stranded DNA-binding protein [Streptomyces celluloflavus]|uniref:single-stranded DNA-binding protein n=1 Tax=Streptomyces celluloflavus TaxID=58344 RepID=UPI0036A2A3DF